jgi:uncharacterized coiled-coil DUF342 family protein
MGMVSDMKELVQDIASSRQDRAERLGEIKEEASQPREEAKDLLKGFQASRQELKAELKEFSDAWQGLTPAKAKHVEKAAPVKVRRNKKWQSQKE